MALPRPFLPLLQEFRDRGIGMMDYAVAPKYGQAQWVLPPLESGVYSLDGEPTRDVLLRQLNTKMVVLDLLPIYRQGITSRVPWQNSSFTARGKFLPEAGLFFSREFDSLMYCRFAVEMAYFAKALGGLDLVAHRDSYFVVLSGQAFGMVAGKPSGTTLGPFTREQVNAAVTQPTSVPSSHVLPCLTKLGWLARGLSEFWQEYTALCCLTYSLGVSSRRDAVNAELDAEIYQRLSRPVEEVPKHTQRALQKSALVQALDIAKSASGTWKAGALFQCLVPAVYNRNEFYQQLLSRSQMEMRVTASDVWKDVTRALEAKLGAIHDERFG